MHPDTPEITRRIRGCDTVMEQRRTLCGAYARQRCVIVTCGPSLGAFDHQRLRAALSGVFTIAIKQALHVVGDQADVACFNSYNVRLLRPATASTLRVYTPEPSGLIPQLNDYDLRLPMAAHSQDLAGSLVGTHDFASFELSRRPTRPWGPGIVHETALYLALHAGVTDVVVIGWDIATGDTANIHFDDPDEQSAFFAHGRDAGRSLAGVRELLPPRIKRLLRLQRAKVRHRSDQVYNRTTMLPEEGTLVARSIPATTRWLQDNGVRLRLVTTNDRSGTGVATMTGGDLLNELHAATQTRRPRD